MFNESEDGYSECLVLYQESNSKLMEQLRDNDVRVSEMTNALTRMTAEEREKELFDQVFNAGLIMFLINHTILLKSTRFVVLCCIKRKEKEN